MLSLTISNGEVPQIISITFVTVSLRLGRDKAGSPHVKPLRTFRDSNLIANTTIPAKNLTKT